METKARRTKTSRVTISSCSAGEDLESACSRSENAFTLIEILIVIGLVALVTGVFVPSFIDAFREQGEAIARKLSVTMGEARDRAMLTDKLVRLKVDIEKQTLTFEEAPSNIMVQKEPEKSPSDREREELEKKEKDTFQPAADLLKDPIKLSNGIKLLELKSPRYKKPLTDGVGYIYFFNNGNTDGATLFFETETKVHMAITVHPITGVSKLEPIGPEEKQ